MIHRLYRLFCAALIAAIVIAALRGIARLVPTWCVWFVAGMAFGQLALVGILAVLHGRRSAPYADEMQDGRE